MPYATPWILDISCPAWNQMDVAMENRLSGSFSNIYPHIESPDGRIMGLDFFSHQTQQLVAVGQFLIRQVEVVRNMSFRYDQCMEWCNR